MGDEIETMFTIIERVVANDEEPNKEDQRALALGAIAFMREIRRAMWAAQCIEERTRPNG